MSLNFGKRKTFAISLVEFAEKLSDPDPSAEATWGAIEIWINGRNICGHTHKETGEYHNSITWPLVYIARWMTANWPRIFERQKLRSGFLGATAHACQVELRKKLLQNNFDEKHPGFIEYDAFCTSHFLNSWVCGGAFPDLGVLPDSDNIILSVENEDSEDCAYYFSISSLNAQIPMVEFVEPIKHFVAWVEKRLLASHNSIAINESQEFSKWLAHMGKKECEQNVLTGILGFSIDQINNIENLVLNNIPDMRLFPDELVSNGSDSLLKKSAPLMLLRSSSPVLTEEDVARIFVAVLSQGLRTEAAKKLQNYWPSLHSRSKPEQDFEDGYLAAVLMREKIGNTDERIDVEAFVRSLGIPVLEITMCDRDIDGAAIWDENTGPLIVINPDSHKASTPWGRRMTLSHELGHLLMDKSQFQPLGVSGPWASPGVERRANAFAAELLVPKEGLLKYFESRRWDYSDECIQELSDKFDVGHTMIFNHLHNRLKDTILLPSM